MWPVVNGEMLTLQLDQSELVALIESLAKQGNYLRCMQLSALLVQQDAWNQAHQERSIDLALRFLDEAVPDDQATLTILSRCLRFGTFIEKIAPRYFNALGGHLRDRRKLESPGQLVIGLGPGRSGSTSLAQLLTQPEDAHVTHEVPPPIFVQPTSAQLDFHFERFDLLRQYHSLIGDVCHWWLYATDPLVAAFPDVKFVTIIRPTQEIVRSFEKVKGSAASGGENHWRFDEEATWRRSYWDFCYPSFDASGVEGSAEEVRAFQIRRYAEEYYKQALSIDPARNLVVDLAELNGPGRRAIETHLQLALGDDSVWLNKGDTSDSAMSSVRGF